MDVSSSGGSSHIQIFLLTLWTRSYGGRCSNALSFIKEAVKRTLSFVQKFVSELTAEKVFYTEVQDDIRPPAVGRSMYER